jgi:hypothetical protein
MLENRQTDSRFYPAVHSDANPPSKTQAGQVREAVAAAEASASANVSSATTCCCQTVVAIRLTARRLGGGGSPDGWPPDSRSHRPSSSGLIRLDSAWRPTGAEGGHPLPLAATVGLHCARVGAIFHSIDGLRAAAFVRPASVAGKAPQSAEMGQTRRPMMATCVQPNRAGPAGRDALVQVDRPANSNKSHYLFIANHLCHCGERVARCFGLFASQFAGAGAAEDETDGEKREMQICPAPRPSARVDATSKQIFLQAGRRMETTKS